MDLVGFSQHEYGYYKLQASWFGCLVTQADVPRTVFSPGSPFNMIPKIINWDLCGRRKLSICLMSLGNFILQPAMFDSNRVHPFESIQISTFNRQVILVLQSTPIPYLSWSTPGVFQWSNGQIRIDFAIARAWNDAGGNSSLYFLLALFSCISASILARTSQKARFDREKWRAKHLVGGLEHFLFSITYGIVLPIDQYFSRWLKPPTRHGFEEATSFTPIAIKYNKIYFTIYLKILYTSSHWIEMIVALLVHEACNGEDEQFFVFMADWLPQVYQLWSIKTSFGLVDQVLLNNCVRPPFEEMSLGESGHRSKRFHLGMAHSWSPKLNGYRKSHTLW